MIVTREFIEGNKSERNGWNFSQIALLGEPWPPTKGWIQRAVGKVISDADAALFIEYGKKRPSVSERRRIKKRIKAQVKREQRVPAVKHFASTDAFLQAYEWRRVRMEALKRDGARCACCGATPADGVRMHVDHIKPRSKFPHMALTLSNLQVLCEVCNHGKGNWDSTDWRARKDGWQDPSALALEALNKAHINSILIED